MHLTNVLLAVAVAGSAMAAPVPSTQEIDEATIQLKVKARGGAPSTGGLHRRAKGGKAPKAPKPPKPPKAPKPPKSSAAPKSSAVDTPTETTKAPIGGDLLPGLTELVPIATGLLPIATALIPKKPIAPAVPLPVDPSLTDPNVSSERQGVEVLV